MVIVDLALFALTLSNGAMQATETETPQQFKDQYPIEDNPDNSRLEDMYTKNLFRSIRNGLFSFLMLIKVFNSWNIMIWTIRKYKQTEGSYNVPEIRLILAQFLKTTILLIAYFLQEMNMIYMVFVLNSVCTYWL